MAWTNENWKKDGSELIISKRDGAILTPLKAGDSVIPADLADNLFKWGAINPSMLQDKFVYLDLGQHQNKWCRLGIPMEQALRH